MTDKPKLWVDRDIPIIALAGETSSGKTLFPILCTDTWQNHGVEPDVVVFDHEGSCDTYLGSMNFKQIDVRALIAEGVHRQITRPDATDPNWRKILLGKADVNDSPSASLFRATYLSLLKIEPGKFRVGSFDTFTPFQAGAAEWVRNHPEAFGRTEKQFASASSMFLWPAVKDMLTYILTVDCRLRFESFVLTLHMKNEWKGDGQTSRKTGERIAEGLDLIDKVATLYATLDRRPKAKGKHAPEVPSGIVVYPHGKSRLVSLVGGKLRPTLPPRVPEFTPQAIREYITNPPDYDNLKPTERLPDESLTDDQRLMINADIARNQAAAAEAETEKVEMMRRAAAMVTGSDSKAAPESVKAPSSPGGSQAAESTGEPAAVVQSDSPLTDQQSAEIKARWQEVWSTPAEMCGYLQERFGVGKPKELSESQATDLILHIVEVVAKKNEADSTGASNAGNGSTQANTSENLPTATNAAKAASHSDDQSSDFATREQIERIKELAGKANWPREKQSEWLRRRGVESFRSVRTDDAAALIERLAKTVSDFEQSGGVPGN